MSNLQSTLFSSFGVAIAAFFRAVADFDLEAYARSLVDISNSTLEATLGKQNVLFVVLHSILGLFLTICSFFQGVIDNVANFLEDVFDANIKHREYTLSGSLNPVPAKPVNLCGKEVEAEEGEFPFEIALSRVAGTSLNPINIPTREGHRTTGTITVYFHYQSVDCKCGAIYTKYETHVYNFNDKGTFDPSDDDVDRLSKHDVLGEGGSNVLELVEFSGDGVNTCISSSEISPVRVIEGTELKIKMIGCSPKQLKLIFSGNLTGAAPEGFEERIKVCAVADMRYILNLPQTPCKSGCGKKKPACPPKPCSS